MTVAPLLDVRDLYVEFGGGPARHEVVRGLSFTADRGRVLAIVGESGSGKSVTALSIMGLLPSNVGRISRGAICFEGRDIAAASPEMRRSLRGARIGMIFQEPMTSLNPVLTIGRQITEGLIAHGRATPVEARKSAIAMLGEVGIADASRRFDHYPHEFSGGMRQRVMIAMAMVMKPALLIADEPTTALDVTVQAQILDLIRRLIEEAQTGLILITHDMGVVAEMADRVLVMRDGRGVEEEHVASLFAHPRDPYTRGLLAAVPRLDEAAAPSTGNIPPSPPILTVQGVTKWFGAGAIALRGRHAVRALDDVSLSLMPSETLALVGESGSGKSTLGRVLAGLADADQGAVSIDGEELGYLTRRARKSARSRVQMIFQDPYASLDPRFTACRTVAEPILVRGLASRPQATDRALALLRRVGLDADMAQRYPHEFSGGQRQRIAIARALAAEPDVIIADEPTSALDVSIQARMLDLLAELREERGVALLFISHDLAVVRRIASRVAVMGAGRLLEVGPTDLVLVEPRHVYTRALLSAALLPDPAARGRARIEVAAGSYPVGPLVEVAPGHWVAS